MGLADTFKGNKYKKELDNLKAIITPEMQDLINLHREIENKKQNYDKLTNAITQAETKIKSYNVEIKAKSKEVFLIDEEILMQSFGLYKPLYDFATSIEYKEQLKLLRDSQKSAIKNKTAYSTNPNWTVNGSTAQGRKMSRDIAKLLLRAFNNECDTLIQKVKFNNFDSYKTRMQKSFDQINKLGTVMNVSLAHEYLKLKVKELHMAYEYAQKVQQEKEEAREERARLREEEKLRKEIEQESEKLKKEEKHFNQALSKLQTQLESANAEDEDAINNKIKEIQEQLNIIDEKKIAMDYRINNTRAGYVYVISNIGAFGEEVYKIGMTRRLEPTDRVKELGDASVPFKYDIHAMIFSNDAPKLENALHNAFRDKAVNMVNNRREFFAVSLDDVMEVIKNNHDKTVEFEKVALAEEYRVSLKMKSQGK